MNTGEGDEEWVTAEELLARLQRDPDFTRRAREREAFRQRAIAEYGQAAAPVVAELNAAGFPVSTVEDLYQRKLEYQAAIPILLRWLPKVENQDVKEAITRALSVKWAKPQAALTLIQEFKQAGGPSEGLKWAMANALSVVADDTVFDQVVALVSDAQHGKAREMLALSLANMKRPEAVDVLIRLLDDNEMVGHAVMALRKLSARRAAPHVRRFLDHPQPWVRREAKKFLSKVEPNESGK